MDNGNTQKKRGWSWTVELLGQGEHGMGGRMWRPSYGPQDPDWSRRINRCTFFLRDSMVADGWSGPGSPEADHYRHIARRYLTTRTFIRGGDFQQRKILGDSPRILRCWKSTTGPFDETAPSPARAEVGLARPNRQQDGTGCRTRW